MIRRTGLRPPQAYHRDARLYVVAVEGEEQEPWYFNGLRDSGLVPAKRIRLKIVPPEKGRSAPEHVAAALRVYEVEYGLIDDDVRWLVVDVDRHHNLLETLRAAKDAGWSFSVSNPCFEVWLQLHFVDEATGEDSRGAKASWGSLRKDRPEPWPFDAVAIERACVRAERGWNGADWVPARPGTTVARLVRVLTGAAGRG